MLKFFRISGDSMAPNLGHGDYAVAFTWLKRPRAGQLAVVSHPRFGVIVKRVKEKTAQGYWFESDNALGVTPEQIGVVPARRIIGRVVLKIRRRPGAVIHNISH
jgi:phage repressor protein C with HTH and peptisase S24 domain